MTDYKITFMDGDIRFYSNITETEIHEGYIIIQENKELKLLQSYLLPFNNIKEIRFGVYE